MLHSRYECVGCSMDDYIFVAGGTPADLVGRSMERYTIYNDT